jgi:hypothetical protein
MKKILLVLFFAMIGSMIFTTYSCNDPKPKTTENADEMLEDEEDLGDEMENDSIEIELDSMEQDSMDLEDLEEEN